MIGLDLSAQRAQVPRESVGDALGATARDRPSHGVRACQEDHGEGTGRWPAQRHEGVGRHPAQERFRLRGAEATGQPGRRLQGVDAEPPERDRMAQRATDPQGADELARDQLPIPGNRADQAGVALAILSQGGRSRGHVAADERRRPVVERVSDGDRRLDPLQAVLSQGQLGEDGGRSAQRMDRGADVVQEAGEGQCRGSRASADGGFGLQHQDAASGAGQRDGGRQPVRPGPDHDRVVSTGVGYWYTSST